MPIKKIINKKPTRYPPTNIQEIEAIKIFEYIINSKNVKTDIKKSDKIPNIDGYIVITEDDQTPIGTMEVQIKKLNDNYLDKPRGKCKKGFLSYCENSLLPVLFIVVDTSNDLSYWKLIDRDFIPTIEFRDGADSKVIEIPITNIIKKDTFSYLDEWKQIIQDFQLKLFNYDDIEKLYDDLSKNTEITIGSKREEFIYIHKFLDFINNELENNFQIITKFNYPNYWKLGFAYIEFEKKSVSYILYPIHFSKNDIQIKEITFDVKEKLLRKGLTFVGHSFDNPIIKRPKEYAMEIIHKKLQEIVKYRLLLINNRIIAIEFIISFIYHFHVPFGLPKKEQYTLEEINFGFYKYFPIWVNEVLKISNIKMPISEYFNPDLFLTTIMPNVQGKISKIVQERIDRNDFENLQIDIGSENFSFKLFIHFISFLKSLNIKEIQRLYIPRRDIPIYGGQLFIWSFNSPEEIKTNIDIFFQKFPDVYDSIIDDILPNLKSDIDFFNNFNRLIIVIDVEKTYRSWKDSPQIEYYFLKSEGEEEKKIDIHIKGDRNIPIDKSHDFDDEIKIEGKIYKLIMIKTELLDFIFKEFPMLDYFYDTLKERLDSYFNELDKK